jgi:hypothetical protein
MQRLPVFFVKNIIQIQTPGANATGSLFGDRYILLNSHVDLGFWRTEPDSTVCLQIKKIRTTHMDDSIAIGDLSSTRIEFDSVSIRVKLVRRIPSMDICLLQMDTVLGDGLSFESILEAKKGQKAYCIGFPDGKFVCTMGIVADVSPIEVWYTGLTDYGASGSILFDGDLHPIGLLKGKVKFGKMLQALTHNLGVTACMPLEHAGDLLLGGEEESILTEIALLNRWYAYAISNSSTAIGKAQDIIRFPEMVKRVSKRSPPLSTSSPYLSAFLIGCSFERFPSDFADSALQNTAMIRELDMMWMAYTDCKQRSTSKFYIDEFRTRSMLEKRGRSPEFIRNYISVHGRSMDTVTDLNRLLYKSAICAILVVIVWLLTAGYVFGALRGNVLRRLSIAVGVQIVLWPISFIAFCIYRVINARKITDATGK